MISIAFLRELYVHMEWADSKISAAVRTSARTASDDRVRDLLLHIHTVQHAFLAVWRGESPVIPTAQEMGGLVGVQRWARDYYSKAQAHLAGVSSGDLSRVVTLPWSAMLTEYLGHPPGDTTLGETMFQVTSHSTYHRGQVNARIRELGGEPPNVDYIAWLWLGRPAPEWPATP